MADKSAIEWTDATWNPIVGCSIVSPGCTNCYAMKMAARIQKMNRTGGSGSNYVNHYDGTTQPSKAGAVWTGKVALAPDKLFLKPMSWKSPRRIFVNSMGDLFHESIPDEWIDRAFALMLLSPRHTFQILTKRAERMKSYINRWFMRLAESDQIFPHPADPTKINAMFDWSVVPSILPNVWLGVSCERQQEADERTSLLLQTPASVRFISAEPLLGPIRLINIPVKMGPDRGEGDRGFGMVQLDWVIAGGESGPNARPMHPDWARWLRRACETWNIPFFFKQWGEFVPSTAPSAYYASAGIFEDHAIDRGWCFGNSGGRKPETMMRVGKKSAGRLLDGIEHNAMPQAAALRSPVMTNPQNAEAIVR